MPRILPLITVLLWHAAEFTERHLAQPTDPQLVLEHQAISGLRVSRARDELAFPPGQLRTWVRNTLDHLWFQSSRAERARSAQESQVAALGQAAQQRWERTSASVRITRQ